MSDSKPTKATSQRLARATQALSSLLPRAAVRSSADCVRIEGRLPLGQTGAGLAKDAGALIDWAHTAPGGVGKHDRAIASGTLEGVGLLANETGPEGSREVVFEIFAAESEQSEHGRQWLAKLAVLDRILTSPDEVAGFLNHMLGKLKGKKKTEAAAAILRAVSEGLEG